MSLRRLLVLAFPLLLPAVLAVPLAPPASAKLSAAEWKEVQDLARQLFGSPGHREEKSQLIGRLVEDQDPRSWRILLLAIEQESEAWSEVVSEVRAKEAQIDEVEGKPFAKRYPVDQENLAKWKAELAPLDAKVRAQAAVLSDLTGAVAGGPPDLRKNLFTGAKGNVPWTIRAAAARVAAKNPEEKASYEFLARSLQNDKDPRVRLAALEALRREIAPPPEAPPEASPAGEPGAVPGGEPGAVPPAGEPGATPPGGGETPKPPEPAPGVPVPPPPSPPDEPAPRPPEPAAPGAGETPAAPPSEAAATIENLVISRLADQDWGVQLLAVQILQERKVTRAVPHLISALAVASPRVVEAIATVLREFTGQNFDPYADVWSAWWEEHKEEFQSQERVKAGQNPRPPSDAHFYGLPIKSDRVLFILDMSSSMALPTQNTNPLEKWKPQAPVTGDGDAPPPPPPPEEILSGPKIDVAKHELKKALLKLPETCKFGLIAFNSAILRWKDDLVDASEKNKQDALTWVRSLEAKGTTYIDGALRVAFKMAGMGEAGGAYREIKVDTMILLSDGAPTDDDPKTAKLMDPEIILQHVREWNQGKQIVVNCIGVDMVESIEFLTKLAAENGGTYVDR